MFITMLCDVQCSGRIAYLSCFHFSPSGWSRIRGCGLVGERGADDDWKSWTPKVQLKRGSESLKNRHVVAKNDESVPRRGRLLPEPGRDGRVSAGYK
jgi:hypothetical protein